MEPHHNTMIQFFKGGSTEINMLLYFALFLIFQITATKSLYIDNHPAYFEDSQIEQVSTQSSVRLSTPHPNDQLKSLYQYLELNACRFKATMSQTTSDNWAKARFMFFKI